MKNIFCVFCGKYRKFKHPKISCVFEKTLALSVFAVSMKIKVKNI